MINTKPLSPEEELNEIKHIQALTGGRQDFTCTSGCVIVNSSECCTRRCVYRHHFYMM